MVASSSAWSSLLRLLTDLVHENGQFRRDLNHFGEEAASAEADEGHRAEREDEADTLEPPDAFAQER